MAKREYHKEIMPFFVEDAHKFLADATRSLEGIVAGRDDDGLLDGAIIAVHALKGAAGLFKQEEIYQVSGDLEGFLELGRSLQRSDRAALEALCGSILECLPSIEALVHEIDGDPETRAALFAKLAETIAENIEEKFAGCLESRGEPSKKVEDGMGENSNPAAGNPEIDAEILECFREEAVEIFKVMNECVVILSEHVEDEDALKTLARSFHTLKGSAGLAGLERVQSLALERQNQLEEMVDEGASLNLELLEEIALSVEELQRELSPSAPAKPIETMPLVDAELVAVFAEEAGGYIQEIEGMAASLKGIPGPDEIERLAKLFHTIKGSAGVVGLAEVSSVAKDANDVLEECREYGSAPDGLDLLAFVREHVETIKNLAGFSAVQPESEDPTADDDLQFFAVDTAENLERLTEAILDFEKGVRRKESLEEMFRSVHTIKGASTLVGLQEMVRSSGALEDFLESIVTEGSAGMEHSVVVDLLLEGADTLAAVLNRRLGREFDATHADRDMAQRIYDLRTGVENLQNAVEVGASAPDLAVVGSDEAAEVETVAEPVQDTAPAASAPVPASEAPSLEEIKKEQQAEIAAKKRRERQIIRVDTERLNTLMNLVGELITSRTRLANRIGMLGDIRIDLTARKDRLLELVNDFQMKYEFGQSLGRLAKNRLEEYGDDEQFSELEFDRYDDFNILSRGLIEITSDVSEIMAQLDHFFHSIGEEAGNVAKVTSEMQYEVTQIRMVPASTLFNRLQRPLRDAARQEGKRVELTCIGEETELDKAIVDDLFKPFLHLVRNAVSHGIESRDIRSRANKPTAGTIVLRAFQEGNSVFIEVQDDGGGIDLKQVEARGRELNYVSGEGTPSEQELLNLIFKPGFSTKGEVTDVSGRGVGMDAVVSAINRLNGSISVQTIAGAGTKVVVRLPLTLAINQALVVDVRGEDYAIPLNYVEEALVVSSSDIETVSGAPVIRVRGRVLPLVDMIEFLGHESHGASDSDMKTAVIVAVEDRRVALLIDRVVRRQEIVVKSSGDFLKELGHIAGGTTGGDGRVYFILDVPTIVGQESQGLQAERSLEPSGTTERESSVGASPSGRRGRWVLVVDDSISVRKVASKLLRASGFEVDLAVDGLDALDFLRENSYEAVVTDLEMPQMHGYELIAEIRRRPQTKDLPVVVVTSRTGRKHVEKALELGADACLGKPFTQNDLLGTLEKTIKERAASPTV